MNIHVLLPSAVHITGPQDDAASAVMSCVRSEREPEGIEKCKWEASREQTLASHPVQRRESYGLSDALRLAAIWRAPVSQQLLPFDTDRV